MSLGKPVRESAEAAFNGCLSVPPGSSINAINRSTRGEKYFPEERVLEFSILSTMSVSLVIT